MRTLPRRPIWQEPLAKDFKPSCLEEELAARGQGSSRLFAELLETAALEALRQKGFPSDLLTPPRATWVEAVVQEEVDQRRFRFAVAETLQGEPSDPTADISTAYLVHWFAYVACASFERAAEFLNEGTPRHSGYRFDRHHVRRAKRKVTGQLIDLAMLFRPHQSTVFNLYYADLFHTCQVVSFAYQQAFLDPGLPRRTGLALFEAIEKRGPFFRYFDRLEPQVVDLTGKIFARSEAERAA